MGEGRMRAGWVGGWWEGVGRVDVGRMGAGWVGIGWEGVGRVGVGRMGAGWVEAEWMLEEEGCGLVFLCSSENIL